MATDSEPKGTKGKSHLKAFVLNFVQDAAKEFHSGDHIYNASTPPPDTTTESPTVKAMVNPTVNTMVNPTVNTVALTSRQRKVNPTVKAMVKAMVNPTAKAAINPDDKPTQNILPKLTWRQDTILRILHDKYMEASRSGTFPYCNREDLATISGLATGSIHAALRGLKQKQYFKTQLKPIRISNYTAFIFEINQDLCQKYFTLYPQADDNPNVKSMVKATVRAEVNPTVKAMANHEIRADLPIVSSFLNNLETTTKGTDFLEISTSPEFVYWSHGPNKITEKTFRGYMSEFNLTEPILLRCLDHCRFYLEELGGPEGGIRTTALNFFYGTMRKSGFYAEPKGYKTLSQIRLEQEEKILREMKETAEKRERVRFELEFEKMLEDPKCELYKQCFDRINNFAKEAGKKSANSPVFRAMMLEEFKKIEYLTSAM